MPRVRAARVQPSGTAAMWLKILSYDLHAFPCEKPTESICLCMKHSDLPTWRAHNAESHIVLV